MKIKLSDSVIMPEPTEADDFWTFGNFLGTVIGILENGDVLVEDQESNIWQIHPERLELSIDK